MNVLNAAFVNQDAVRVAAGHSDVRTDGVVLHIRIGSDIYEFFHKVDGTIYGPTWPPLLPHQMSSLP